MNDNNQSLPSRILERLLNGILKENPTFVLLLGMCPTLAVTTSAKNGFGMGATTLVVLMLSNLFISLLRKVIPSKVRIPAFIVIIASFVTVVELLLKAYIPSLYDSLGIYIPLIVVNCIILGRAEAYAYSHDPITSLFDGIGMGAGFTIALTIIGAVRELLGAGTLWEIRVMPESFMPASIFIMAPGAFFVLAMLTAIQNLIKQKGEKKGKNMSKIQSGCGGNCLECELDCKKPEKEAKILLEEAKESQKTKDVEKNKYWQKLMDKKASLSKPKKEKKSSEKDESEETEKKSVRVKAEKEKTVTEKEVKEKEVKEKEVKEKPAKERPAKEKKLFEKKAKEKENKEEISEEPKVEDKTEDEVKNTDTTVEKADKPLEEKIVKKETKKEKKDKKESKPEKKKEEKVEVTVPVKEEEPVIEEEEETILLASDDDSDDFELLVLSDYKKALSENKKGQGAKKPVHRKANMNKAMMMLSKAEETLSKEDD